MLLPPDLRDWLDDDHLAWFVSPVFSRVVPRARQFARVAPRDNAGDLCYKLKPMQPSGTPSSFDSTSRFAVRTRAYYWRFT
jgi:hypothetical protein